MTGEILSVREMLVSDIPLVVDYWLSADRTHLKAMGVDVRKIPSAEQLAKGLTAQIETAIEEKNSYCIIWLLNNEPVGHSNTNPTYFGNEAYMHLHLWAQTTRRHGLGSKFLELTIPYFFENLQLKDLYCQPYAQNAAPNKTLQKLGFEFVKEYVTIPGSLNYEQPVKLWHMSYERFTALYELA